MPETAKESARTILRMFAENELGRGSVWRWLNRADVAAGALARVEDPNLVDQGKADLCGLAVFVRSLAADAPDRYALAIEQLYSYGSAMIGAPGGHFLVKP